jgi:8-oxo-dGTP diphosphatase
MRPSVRVVHNMISGIEPWDELEEQHQLDTLRWLESTDDVFRREKPATPDRHLVSYVVLVDAEGSTLLVDHINAGLWLPPGGHVDSDENPAQTARREAQEELGVTRLPTEHATQPAFVTVTRTVGQDDGHLDVSLWFAFVGQRDMPLKPDPAEIREVRWWSPADVLAEDPGRFDPHYGRFIMKTAR